MSLLDKILGRTGNAPTPSAVMTADAAAQIVRDYRAVLSASLATLRAVADLRELPHPKDEIKQALVMALRSAPDGIVKKELRSAYVFLADFQPVASPDQDPEDTAQHVALQADWIAIWAPVIAAEAEALETELRQLGLW